MRGKRRRRQRPLPPTQVFDHRHHYRFLIESATAAQELSEESHAREESQARAAASPPAAAHPSRGSGGRGSGMWRVVLAGGSGSGSAQRGPAAHALAARISGHDLSGASDEGGSDFDDSRVSSRAASPTHPRALGGSADGLAHPSSSLLRRPLWGSDSGVGAAGVHDGAASAARPPRHPPAGGHDMSPPPRSRGVSGSAPGAAAAAHGEGHEAMRKGQGSFVDISTALHSMARGVGPSRLSSGGGGGVTFAAAANGPPGISPYDTPYGSPRGGGGWRLPHAPPRGSGLLPRAPASGSGAAAAAAAAPGDAFGGRQTTLALDPGRDLYPRLEAMAACAVRAADKVDASLIVVLSHTSTAARLVSKYRPKQPVRGACTCSAHRQHTKAAMWVTLRVLQCESLATLSLPGAGADGAAPARGGGRALAPRGPQRGAPLPHVARAHAAAVGAAHRQRRQRRRRRRA